MVAELPTAQQRLDIDVCLGELIEYVQWADPDIFEYNLIDGSAVTEHPLWKDPPNPNPTLYHVWDLVMRSKYMLSEYENIRAGRPLQHPNQFRGGVGVYHFPFDPIEL